MREDKKKLATAPRDRTKTEQTVGTDPAFFALLNERYRFAWDLACTSTNCLVRDRHGGPLGYTDPYFDALSENWSDKSESLEGFSEYDKSFNSGFLFLNPPFKNIGPWAKKCRDEAAAGAKIVFLVPASVGSKWFERFVFGNSHVYFLNPRLTFAGHKNPYPKDMLIAVFTPKTIGRGSVGIWNWKKNELSTLTV